MSDFLRLMQLAGIKILVEALTPSQAAGIFKSLGATDADLATPAGIKSARNRLVRAQHSDTNGGDDEATKNINAAYDILKKFPDGYKDSYSSSSSYKPRPSEDRDEPRGPAPWQTDKRSSSDSIYRQSYADINYFKKKMWELSGESTKEYTIWAFDGSYFRGCLTVYGSPKIFDQMAVAMITWNGSGNPYATRAVFVQEEHKHEIYLIYVDKHFLKTPIPFDHDSFNKNPGNDQYFVRKLPEQLDGIVQEIKNGDIE